MGCIHAPVYDQLGNAVQRKCPFCRMSLPTCDEEFIKRMKKRAELEDAHARGLYYDGERDCQMIITKHWNFGISQQSSGMLQHIAILVVHITMAED